jgi:O-antigen ligase
VVSAILLVLFLGALTSKNIFIVMIVYVILMIYRIIKSNLSPDQKRKFVFMMLALIPIFLIMVRLLIWQRFSSIFQELNSIGKDVRFNNSTGSRLSALLVGIDLMKQKLLLGYGTANGNAVLLQELEYRGYTDLVKWKMHTHNQYLKYGLEYGLIGLFIFLGTWLFSLANAIKYKQYLPMILLVMLGVHCFTDDVLDVQYGILFFLPWLSILLINHSFRNAYTFE